MRFMKHVLAAAVVTILVAGGTPAQAGSCVDGGDGTLCGLFPLQREIARLLNPVAKKPAQATTSKPVTKAASAARAQQR